MMSYPPGSMETAANIGASQTTIPTTGVYNNKQDIPGIMYLDHAQIKLMLRRITHVKELLSAETVNFMRTKAGRYNAHSSLGKDDHDDAMEALTTRRLATKMTAVSPGGKFETTSLGK